MVLDTHGDQGNIPLGPRRGANVPCPLCSGKVQSIQLFPLGFQELKKSIELRVKEAASSGRDIFSTSPVESNSICGIKRDRETSGDLLEVEAAHAVFAQGKHGASISRDSDALRTGRWTEEEMEYVDVLIKAFDKGQLPLPHGTKLCSFLCDALLCKSSRLTKKMKNAKLSARNFELGSATIQTNACLQMAQAFKLLQDRFVMSMPSEYKRLEFGFNLSMHWRTCFSDLCVQIGYPNLDGSAFIASLEEYERLASNADEGMRNVRRRRMVGSFSSDGPCTSLPLKSNSVLAQLGSNGGTNGILASRRTCTEELLSETGIPSIDLFLGGNEFNLVHGEKLHDSFTGIFEADEGNDGEPESSFHRLVHGDSVSRDPFLEVIADYLEELDLPFQHADVWVPSFVNGGSNDDICLLHAGGVTRRDQDGHLWSAFESFGAYSKSFSFAPGRGLVGRVFASGKTMWEFGLNKLDPEFFLRVGGAEEYGVRTAVGIPFSTSGVGRMVVELYSCNHIPEDSFLAFQFAQELSRYAPAPKWKLVVEMSDETREGGQALSSGERPASIGELPPAGKETVSRSSRSCLVPPSETPGISADQDKDVAEIISLIGEELAIEDGNAIDDPTLFQQLMNIRLLMLRSSNRRSAEENDKIDILKNSYKNYSADDRRTGRELTILLAREWLCLSEVTGNLPRGRVSPQACDQVEAVPDPMSSKSTGQYTSHEFSPVLKPMNSFKRSSTDMGNGMMTPPLYLPSTANVSRNFNRRDNSVMVFDHNHRTLAPPMTSKVGQPPLFHNTMGRTVSCGTIPSMSSHSDLETANRTNGFFFFSKPARGQSFD